MIRTKKELNFYIKADRMMQTGKFKSSLKDKLINLIVPNYIFKYCKIARKCSYLSNRGGVSPLLSMIYKAKRRKLGMKLGFSISLDNVGYGIVIPHYGTIVVGAGNQIGNYTVLHTSTCITQGKKVIGDGFYLSTGAKVIRDVTIGNNVSVGANSLVNSEFENNCMIAGNPARKIKDSDAWYIRDGAEYSRRVNECEKLKKQYQL